MKTSRVTEVNPMDGVPYPTEAMTPARLTEILTQAGILTCGEVSEVYAGPDDSFEGHEADFLRLHIRYTPDASCGPGRLFLKQAIYADPSQEEQERCFYSQVAPKMIQALPESSWPFVRCYYAAHNDETGLFELLLEDPTDTHFTLHPVLPPPLPQTNQVIQSLASLHAFWWEHPLFGCGISERPTSATIDAQVADAQIHLVRMLDFLDNRLSPDRRKTLELICSKIPDGRRQRLEQGLGLTVVNHDTHPANFLYPRDPKQHTVRLINWQCWQPDTGTDDLAFFMAAHWYPDRRSHWEGELVVSYHERLLDAGIEDYSLADCWYDYRASVIGVVFSLVRGWNPTTPVSPWWGQLNRALMAYDDLECHDLLLS